MNEVKEEFKTETKYQPVNGRMLIKVVTEDFPTMNIMTGAKPNTMGSIKMFIAGTSISGYNLGDEVLVEPREIANPDNKIFDDDNERSYSSIKAHINSLKKSEYDEFVKKNPRLSIVEYVIIHNNFIIAKVVK